MKLEEIKSGIVSKQTWADVLNEMGIKPEDENEDGVLILKGDKKETNTVLAGNTLKAIDMVTDFDFDQLKLHLMITFLKLTSGSKNKENGGNENAK